MVNEASAPISFSPAALREISRLVSQEKAQPPQFLRIGVKGGGCSGLSYILKFDQQRDNDQVFEFAGLRFIMDKAHLIYLLGMEINWQDGLNARGFTFSNPNASKSCGCGSSFAV